MVPNQPDVKQVAEVLQAMAARGGFDLKIRLTEFTTSLAEAVKGNFQVYLIGWSGRVDPDQNVINHLGCDSAVQLGQVLQREDAGRLNEARTVSDPAKRKAAYEEALTQIEADKPLIYIYHQRWSSRTRRSSKATSSRRTASSACRTSSSRRKFPPLEAGVHPPHYA